MINLFVCYDVEKWKSNTDLLERDRCLTEYIMPEFKATFGTLNNEYIEQIKRIPCIFTYEQVHRKDAYIGRITDISVRQLNVKIDYELTGDIIRFEDFVNLAPRLDMGHWELNRTHWTIKNVDIEEVRPYFSSNLAPKPTVFISYSWTPVENQRKVFDLVGKLSADGINVIYDKADLHPGQDMGYFMERAITNHEIDNVLVICNRDYAEKANTRRGGVGYEAEIILSEVLSEPLQRRVIPVVIETDERGTAYLPTSLKSRFYIDLTTENGYNELLDAIWQKGNVR